MKDELRARRILCVALAAVAVAALAEGGTDLPLRNDVVAVVLSNLGTPRAEVTVSYPGAVSRAQVEQDLAAMATAAAWRLAPPAIQTGEHETQAVASIHTTRTSGNASVGPVWAAVWALKRFSRVVVAGVGGSGVRGRGSLDNRFVRAVWSDSGGLWSCDVAIKDRSFRSLSELTAPEAGSGRESRAQKPRRAVEEPTRGRWWVILGAALILAASAYLLAARLFAATGRSRDSLDL